MSPTAVRNAIAAESPPTGPFGRPKWPEHPSDGPLMNLGDVIWNNGEEADSIGTDHGGLIDWRDHPAVLDGFGPTGLPGANVFQYQGTGTNAPEGWVFQPIGLVPTPTAGNQFWRLRGYLSDQRRVGWVRDAAFEIIAPRLRDPTKPTVIVLETPQTMGGPDANHGAGFDIGPRAAYPGWDSDAGLHGHPGLVAAEYLRLPPHPAPTASVQHSHEWTAHLALMLRNEGRRASGTLQYNVVSVRVMPHLSFRPARFQMQRNVEVIRAVVKMFTDGTADSRWRPPGAFYEGEAAVATHWDVILPLPLPCMIEGGSLGGAMATWAATFFPQDFHGAASFGAGGSVRSWVGEQTSQVNLAALSGFSRRAQDLGPNEVLHYSALFYGIQQFHGCTYMSPFYHSSVVRAWREGRLARPIYLNISDEDFVTHGTDVIPWISGQQELKASGFSTPNVNGIQLSWSVTPKNCHQRQKPFEFPIPGGSIIESTYEDAILDFLPQVVAAAATNAPFIPVNSPVEDATEDIYEHFLQPAAPVPAPTSGLALHLDTTFSNPVPVDVRRPGKSFGIGTRLGERDSMIIPKPFEGGASEVFVGSAEGVVTQLVVNSVTQEVVPVAMSPALGSGAWALAMGEVDGAPGKELIVATYRGLHVLYRFDLSVMRSRRDLPWDMGRPRHMRVADVVPGGFSEIVMVSDLGRLAIYDTTTLTEIAHYGEAGIIDLQVLGTSPHLELAILSERGHVVNLEWNVSAGNLVVTAISPRLNGVPADMERCDALVGQPALAVSMGLSAPGHNESLYVLDAATLAPIDHQITQEAGGEFEVFSGGFIFLHADEVVALPYQGPGSAGIAQRIPLAFFPPMMRAIDIAVDETSERLFVSTEAGYVCWLDLADLMNGALSFTSAVRTGTTAVNFPPAHCNRTLSATWGMVADAGALEVIDQAGTRWSVAANGDVTLKSEVGRSSNFGLTISPAYGPFRAMRKLAGLTTANSETSLVSVGTLPVFPTGVTFLAPQFTLDIRTFPFEPGNSGSTPATWDFDETVQFGDPGVFWASSGATPLHHQYVHDGYVVFTRGGDVQDLSPPGPGGVTRHVCWWGGDAADGNWPNRVQGIAGTPTNISAWWSSAGGQQVVAGNLQFLPSNSITGHDLRNQVSASLDVTDAQALRLFTDPIASAPRVAVFTPGARLIVLEPGQSSSSIGGAPLESDATTGKVLDFGSGGMALAVGGTRSGQFVDLYLGPQAFFAKQPGAGATTAENLVSAIVHVEYQGATSFSSAQLRTKQLIPLDAAGLQVYGVCGMAVGDVIGGSLGNGTQPELVVGSLDGNLLVYAIDATTGDIGATPIYQQLVEGAVGVFNSIVIADLAAPLGQNELYVAGSLGLRRWVP